MRPSSKRIDIATSTQKLSVDHRISLRIYFRIADNILRQANIFRNEKNIIDLYVMLLRFSSLVSETLPRHREYATSPLTKRTSLKKQLVSALNELEALKPAVKLKVEELRRKPANQVIEWNQSNNVRDNLSQSASPKWPPAPRQFPIINQVAKASQHYSSDVYGGLKAQQKAHTVPVEERFRKLSVTFPRPTEESLLRHSILGPNGLSSKWHPPVSEKGVHYPSNIDLSPVEIPRLHQVFAVENEVGVRKDNSTLEPGRPSLETVPEPSSDNQKPLDDEQLMISFETSLPDPVIVRQPSPPPILAEVQDLIPTQLPLATENQEVMDNSSSATFLQAEAPMELHVSTSMMETFLRLANSNTKKNLETCGILAGSLKNRKFYITALIIPKQESTTDTCQATNEEEIFDVQDKQSLFPLGWIHTHPTQSCFMSSVDVHTHYAYQVMLPEAVAIVMAPQDIKKNHGIFRLTTPGGMSVIRHCERRGFHSHEQPADGGPIYKQCTDVYMDPKLKFDIIDLR